MLVSLCEFMILLYLIYIKNCAKTLRLWLCVSYKKQRPLTCVRFRSMVCGKAQRYSLMMKVEPQPS